MTGGASGIGENALKRPGPGGGVPQVSDDDHLPPGTWMEGDEAARIILGAVRRGDLYVITHPETSPRVEARRERIRDAFVAAARPLPHGTDPAESQRVPGGQRGTRPMTCRSPARPPPPESSKRH